MTGQIGQNTPNAEKLRGYVDELERIDAQKAELGVARGLIVARARSEGFEPKAIAYLLKVRKMKPHDRADAETLRDVYLHAMDMAPELPLFRQIAALVDDAASEEKVLAALKHLAPAKGDIIMRMGATSVRIFRDTHGLAQVEPYVEVKKAAPEREPFQSREKPPVPDVTAEVAFDLGSLAALGNVPVIENPFPYGDPRRARWDEGWRAGNGGDGFGGKP